MAPPEKSHVGNYWKCTACRQTHRGITFCGWRPEAPLRWRALTRGRQPGPKEGGKGVLLPSSPGPGQPCAQFQGRWNFFCIFPFCSLSPPTWASLPRSRSPPGRDPTFPGLSQKPTASSLSRPESKTPAPSVQSAEAQIHYTEGAPRAFEKTLRPHPQMLRFCRPRAGPGHRGFKKHHRGS